MTRDDIIRMAREAGGYATNFNGRWMFYMADIERFAALIAAHEREECARVCEQYTDSCKSEVIDHEAHGYCCADAIRARTK